MLYLQLWYDITTTEVTVAIGNSISWVNVDVLIYLCLSAMLEQK